MTILPARGDIVRYYGDPDLAVEVLTDPIADPSGKECGCGPDAGHVHGDWEMQVRYLDNHPTGAAGSVWSWGIRAGDLHLFEKVDRRV